MHNVKYVELIKIY